MTPEPHEAADGTPRTMSKAEAARVLRRSGFTTPQIDELFSELDDPIDLERDGAVLQRHGITRGHLMDDMGASP